MIQVVQPAAVRVQWRLRVRVLELELELELELGLGLGLALELAWAESVAQLAAAMATTAQPQWAVPAQSTRQAAPCRPSRSYALRPF